MNICKTISKKHLLLLFITLILVSTFSACGVFSERDPLSRQSFLDAMEEHGFTVIDYTDELTSELEEMISLYLIAVSPSGAYQIEFIELYTIEDAQAVFFGTKENADALSGRSSSYSSVNGPNHNVYRLTSAGLYSHLLRVDDIFVFVLGADAGYRDEIRSKIDLISS